MHTTHQHTPTRRFSFASSQTNVKLKEAVRAESQRCSQLQEALEEFKKKAMRSQQQIDRLTHEKVRRSGG